MLKGKPVKKRPTVYRHGNKFACGSTRSGKSEGELPEIVAAAKRRDLAIVCCDPHPRSLAWKALQQLAARGHQSRIIFDQLPHFGRVPGYQFLVPSKARNPYRRESQNEQTARQFADILCRRGNRGSLSSAPLTEEWTMKATQLLLAQRSPRPASDLRYAFQPDHPIQKLLIRNCTDKLIAFEFSQIASGKTKRGQYAPAARLIEGVCGSPAFRARCGNTFAMEPFLDDGGMLLVEGGEDGVAPEVSQTIMSSIVMKVINYVRKRPTPFPRVLLVLDEATNANLVSSHEAAALAECQKMGLDIHILVQLLDFPTADICNAVLSNSVRHEWYYNANPNVIRKAIDDLGLRAGDSFQGDELRSLKVGERWVKYRGKTKERVWREQGQLLQNPWVLPRLATKKGFKALAEIRRRPEFQTPVFDDENQLANNDQPKIGSTGSAAENLRRLIEQQQNDDQKPRLPEPAENDNQDDHGGDDD